MFAVRATTHYMSCDICVALQVKPVKISFVMPFISLVGGNRVIAIYAQKLKDMGHTVTVISQPQRRDSWWVHLKCWVKRRPAPRIKPPSPLFDTLGDSLVVLDKRRPVTAQDMPDADVVIATWWHTAEWVATLPPEKGRKFYLVQDYEMFGNLPLERVAATYAHPMTKITVSDYIREMLETHHDVKNAYVVPNAVDIVQFDAPARSKNARLRVGFLYTNKTRKRTGLSIALAEKVHLHNPDIEFCCFSATPPHPDLPLPTWITFHQTPAQDEIPKIYAGCDLWLFTSSHEGFGLPLLEAMACRTPVLATRAGAAEMVIDGTNGRLLEPDVDVFFDHVLEFQTMSPADWRRCSDAAYHTSRNYSWDDAVRSFLNVLGGSPEVPNPDP